MLLVVVVQGLVVLVGWGRDGGVAVDTPSEVLPTGGSDCDTPDSSQSVASFTCDKTSDGNQSETWGCLVLNKAKSCFFPSRPRSSYRQNLQSVERIAGRSSTRSSTIASAAPGRLDRSEEGECYDVGGAAPQVRASRSWAPLARVGAAAATPTAGAGADARASPAVHHSEKVLRRTWKVGGEKRDEREKQRTDGSRPSNPKSLRCAHPPPVKDARLKPPTAGAGDDNVAVQAAALDNVASGAGRGGAASQTRTFNDSGGQGYGGRTPSDNVETGSGETTTECKDSNAMTFRPSRTPGGAGAGVGSGVYRASDNPESPFSDRSGKSIIEKGDWAASRGPLSESQGRFLTVTPDTAAKKTTTTATTTTTRVVSRTSRARGERVPSTTSDSYARDDRDERLGRRYHEKQQQRQQQRLQQQGWAPTDKNSKVHGVRGGGGGGSRSVGRSASARYSVANPFPVATTAFTTDSDGGSSCGGGVSTRAKIKRHFPGRPQQVTISPGTSAASWASSTCSTPATALDAPQEEWMSIVSEAIAVPLRKRVTGAVARPGRGRGATEDVKTASTAQVSSGRESEKLGTIDGKRTLSEGTAARAAAIKRKNRKKNDNKDNEATKRDAASDQSNTRQLSRWVPGVVGTGHGGTRGIGSSSSGGEGGGGGEQGFYGGQGRGECRKGDLPAIPMPVFCSEYPAKCEVCGWTNIFAQHCIVSYPIHVLSKTD